MHGGAQVNDTSPSRALVRHNRVLSKLRKEVQDVLGDDAHVTKAKLQNMPYLKCIMTESE